MYVLGREARAAVNDRDTKPTARTEQVGGRAPECQLAPPPAWVKGYEKGAAESEGSTVYRVSVIEHRPENTCKTGAFQAARRLRDGMMAPCASSLTKVTIDASWRASASAARHSSS